MEKWKLLEEMLQEKPKKVENLKEEVMSTPKKTKFGRKAIDDVEFGCRSIEEIDLRTTMIGTILISLNCSTISPTLLDFFKSKEMKESLVEVKKRAISSR